MNDQKTNRYEAKNQNNPFSVIHGVPYSWNIYILVRQEDVTVLSYN